MPSFAQELLTVDRQRLDVPAGPLGLAVLSVFGVGPIETMARAQSPAAA